ncbi:MAG: hypothetical protein V7K32_22555 [Nostoc sp.]
MNLFDSSNDIDDDEDFNSTNQAANLLAELPLNQASKVSVEVLKSVNNIPFLSSGIVEEGSSKLSFDSYSTQQSSVFQISSLHSNTFQIASAQISSTQIGTHEAPTKQICPRKINNFGDYICTDQFLAN